MTSKDQKIGAVILIVAVVVIILYTWWVFVWPWPSTSPSTGPYGGWTFKELSIVIPVFLLVIAILAIAAWIGYTMATTPPPKPLEEIPELSESEGKKENGEKKEAGKT